MNYLPPLPPELQQVEYVKLYFHLQVKDYFDLPQLGLLQLRREFMQALQTLEGWGGNAETSLIRGLLQPALSTDPLIRRQTQKPTPAFVLTPGKTLQGLLTPQQTIVLPVLFLGRSILAIDPFISLLQQLGQQGLYHGTGQFFLEGVESEDGSGVRMMHWSAGKKEPFSPPVSELSWLLERQAEVTDRVVLQVTSPLRLLKGNKPLFKTGFTELFPFIMRRVSSMLACHAGVEVIKEPQMYLGLAAQVEVQSNRLQWQDWRQLEGERRQDLGGLLGEMELSGSCLAELIWVLQLGSLFNLGKGAAYGAGQYRLRTYC